MERQENRTQRRRRTDTHTATAAENTDDRVSGMARDTEKGLAGDTRDPIDCESAEDDESGDAEADEAEEKETKDHQTPVDAWLRASRDSRYPTPGLPHTLTVTP